MKMCGEVSNRLIIGLPIGLVLVMLAIPLGFTLYPRIAEKFEAPENLVLVFQEGFEGDLYRGPNGTMIPKGWSTWRGPCISKVTTDHARSGARSFQCTGQAWGGGLTKNLHAKPPLVIEYDIYTGDEPLNSSIRNHRGALILGPTGKIVHGHGKGILRFNMDGRVMYMGRQDTGFRWTPFRWYHVRVHYEHSGEVCRIQATIDSIRLPEVEEPLVDWQKEWGMVDVAFSTGSGSSYFDNIRVFTVAGSPRAD